MAYRWRELEFGAPSLLPTRSLAVLSSGMLGDWPLVVCGLWFAGGGSADYAVVFFENGNASDDKRGAP